MKFTLKGNIVSSVIILLISSLFLGILGCNGDGGRRRGGSGSGGPRMVIGQPAPDFTATAVDGRTITLSDYKGQKYVILDMFATWCGPCKAEWDALQPFYLEHSDRIEIISISKEPAEEAEKVQLLIDDKSITFPVIHQPSQEIYNMYPPRSGIPYLVFIDIEGIAVSTKTGYNPMENLSAVILREFGLN